MDDFDPKKFEEYLFLTQDDENDRIKNLSGTELELAIRRRNGEEEPCDLQGRQRTPLGDGPESRLARAIYPFRQPRPKKRSDCLAHEDFQRLYEAVATANIVGLVLNTFVTISWKSAGISQDGAWGCHTDFTDRMRMWFNNRGCGKPHYIWVRENGRLFGDHSHFLVHVPEHMQGAFARWARKAALGVVGEPAVPVQKRLRAIPSLCWTDPTHGCKIESQWKIFRYLMKGVAVSELSRVVSPQLYKFLANEFGGIKKSAEGVVLGQRAGTSQALGPSACRCAEEFIGRSIWPRFPRTLDPLPLAYDDSFLREGERARLPDGLATLDI